jgi:hypothetical protein
MEVKPGFLTSEFWVMLFVQLVGVAAALGYLNPEDAETWQKASVQLGGIFAQVASAIYYAFTRKSVKVQASKTEEACGCQEKKPGPGEVSVLSVFLCIALLSCTANVPLVPVDEMPPEQKAGFFMSLYNREYNDYLSVATMPNLTEDQKVILRKKKNVLTRVYPMIESYSDYVAAGAMPSQASEKAIMDLLNEAGKLVAQ